MRVCVCLLADEREALQLAAGVLTLEPVVKKPVMGVRADLLAAAAWCFDPLARLVNTASSLIEPHIYIYLDIYTLDICETNFHDFPKTFWVYLFSGKLFKACKYQFYRFLISL